ncbi:putative leucine-rich repeat domain superfamily, F-box-like domain superfamily [Helianthus annuus]|uniref:Leucine-rich repeat domain superfamily, F-box-like domain superfamily n=1 Tax=Helianthus annuus TaxID=4232 RepID=A0A9K3JBL6_HELAN|nr:putative leucine-rich repeat domain superfamily, F-box-like domain superfamily [Helianthus annuus]KAJ0606379.1 putative F-box protein AUF1 [Helianthus annuus]KAJ0933675.1 putative leucine-rich repeat domain superfamily, F-box-like domain superfamily [Helianthus annuus]
MDELPESLLLEILSRLDNSADIASCRVASKALNTVFPDLRTINLYCSSRKSSISLKKVFVDLISKLRIVESVCICLQDAVDEDFAKEWLPRVSQSLNSLSLSGSLYQGLRPSNVLTLVSVSCHNLAELNLGSAWLSVRNLNPMPMLTSLTLSYTIVQDQHLNQFNKCFLNLQVLNLICVRGLKDPKIHHLNLQTCHWYDNNQLSLTLITPNLITLRIDCFCAWLKLEACWNPEDWEISDGRKGLKTIRAYLMLVDPSLTFSYVACVLDQCVGLSVVSLLIHANVVDTESKSFMSECMARWPQLKWRWGIWGEYMKDTWITD